MKITGCIALLTDTTSPVPGFEKDANDLEVFLVQSGVQLSSVNGVFV